MLRKIIFALFSLLIFTPVLAQQAGQIPESVKTCLSQTVGETNFKAVLDGERGPTPDEVAAAQKAGCFQDFNPSGKPSQQTNRPAPPAEFRSCAEKAIADKSRAKLLIEQGAQATDQERQAIQKTCFKDQGKPPIQVDNEAFECAKKKLGDEAFNKAVANGAADLPQDKKDEINQECFKGKFKPPEGERAGPPDFSEKTSSCLKEKGIDSAKLKQFFEQRQEPPAEIRDKMFSCFEGGDKRGQSGPQGAFQAPEGFLTCIKSEFGVDPRELGERFGPDKKPSDEDAAKMEKCQRENNFQPGGPAGQSGPGGQPPPLPDNVKSCLADKLGIPQDQVQTRRFNQDDQKKVGACFEAAGQGGPGQQGGFRPPEGFIKCVQDSFGVSESQLADRFGPNKQPSEEDRAKIEKCQTEHKFNPPGDQQGGRPKPPPISDEVKNCLGSDLYNRAFVDQGQISEDDKKAVGACFQKFGPPPTEQRPSENAPQNQGQFGPPPQGQGAPGQSPQGQFGPPPAQNNQPIPPPGGSNECFNQAQTEQARQACFGQ